jgi:DNA repair protein RadC
MEREIEDAPNLTQNRSMERMLKNERAPISTWAEDDRPREKMLNKGKTVLSDAELLAILLGHGTRKKSAVDLGRDILNRYGHDLSQLARSTMKELCAINGVGAAKAATIMAALELGARRKTPKQESVQIAGSKDAYHAIHARLEDLHYEEFWIITLNQVNRIVGMHRVGEGGITGTVADPRRILKLALDDHATSLILCHNHPSGNLRPSDADLKLTRKMKNAASLMDIQLLDHLIIAHTGYLSFADDGLL